MKEYLCTNCGKLNRYHDDYHHGSANWQRLERRQFFSGDALPVDVAEYERIEPIRLPEVGSHFSTPALQSFLSGLLAAMIAIPIVIYFSWPWWSPLMVGVLAFALCWLMLVRYFNSLLIRREHVRAADPAPVKPDPVPAPIIRLEIEEERGRVKRFADLPIEEAKLRTVARAIVGGRPFSIGSMTGRGRPLTRGEFETLRDWLLSVGYCQWADPANRRAGVTFTAKGKALVRGLA